jgi:hypothetical protein
MSLNPCSKVMGYHINIVIDVEVLTMTRSVRNTHKEQIKVYRDQYYLDKQVCSKRRQEGENFPPPVVQYAYIWKV